MKNGMLCASWICGIVSQRVEDGEWDLSGCFYDPLGFEAVFGIFVFFEKASSTFSIDTTM